MRLALLTIGLALAWPALSTPALAAAPGDMPAYDPNASCKALADRVGNHSIAVANNCIDQEQMAYNDLKQQWYFVPADGMKACLPVAVRAMPLQYTSLQACLRPYVTREWAKQPHVFHR